MWSLHDDDDTNLRQSSDYRPTNITFDWSRLDGEGQMGKQKAETSKASAVRD